MPELPEVETIRRGIIPYVVGHKIMKVVVRERRLRWLVPSQLNRKLVGQTPLRLERRGKYLLLYFESGCLLLHFGMSGTVRIKKDVPPARHDHLDIVFDAGYCLRFNDPRKFGSVLWIKGDPLQHRLLRHLGHEPFVPEFSPDYLYGLASRSKRSIKSFIMDSSVVVGVGNIYANEALFMAGIRPTRQVNRIAKKRYYKLVVAITTVLSEAIQVGGTSLKDFADCEGKPGYFVFKLQVYGRADEPCLNCGHLIIKVRQQQRSSYYCSTCQR